MKFASTFLILAALASCTSERANVSNEQAVTKVSSSDYLQKAASDGDLGKLPNAVDDSSLPRADVFALENEMLDNRLFAADPSIAKGQEQPKFDWKRENVKALSFLEKKKSDKLFSFLRQSVATRMLSKTNLLTDDSQEALPVIAKYVEILAQEKNGSPAYFYYSLAKLKNYWPEEKIKSIAEIGIQGGKNSIKSYLASNSQLSAEMKKTPDSSIFADIIEGNKEICTAYEKYISKLERM